MGASSLDWIYLRNRDEELAPMGRSYATNRLYTNHQHLGITCFPDGSRHSSASPDRYRQHS